MATDRLGPPERGDLPMPALTIRACRPGDLARVRELHRSAFRGPDGPRAGLSPVRRHSAGGEPRVWVADSRDRVVGFASLEVFGEAPDHLEGVRALVRTARSTLDVGRRRSSGVDLGWTQIVWQSFENDLTCGDLRPEPEDVYLTAMTVAAPFRRMGIGTALARHRIGLARELGARHVWVGCWEGGRAVHLYEKLGFLPVVRWGPAYEDGSIMRLMAFSLDAESGQRGGAAAAT